MVISERIASPFRHGCQIEFPQITQETAQRFKNLERDLRSNANALGRNLSITQGVVVRLVYGEEQRILQKRDEEDMLGFSNEIEKLVYGYLGIKNRKKRAEVIRWTYASSGLFLTDEASRRRKAVPQKLKQVAKQGILDATDLTEKLEKKTLDRIWLDLNIFDFDELINPNRDELLENLTIFVNNPPLATGA